MPNGTTCAASPVCCPNLQRQGVAPRVAMELMRHSDIKLTANVYTDAMQLPTREAVQALPSYVGNAEEKRPLRRPLDLFPAGRSETSRVPATLDDIIEETPIN